ncbi:hypothetical protein Acr_00g0026390 [Actinidia rufa]|uniref:Uncharacterized protein n=1 Tax=Actinidia rufa TaxID=165716 RepID=A0A7J0DDM1_9ERIC|nr:hypothetical protein Acr_00g0026390 [Actinidia rufa]
MRSRISFIRGIWRLEAATTLRRKMLATQLTLQPMRVSLAFPKVIPPEVTIPEITSDVNKNGPKEARPAGEGNPKKGMTLFNAKKKEPLPSPYDKKKGPSTKPPTKSKVNSRLAMIQDMPTFVAPRKGTLVNPGLILGLESFALDNHAMAKKLFQGVVLPIDKNSQNEEEKGPRQDVDDEFKASNEYKEAIERAASSYFGEDFDLCNKKISILHPVINIHDLQINPDLVDEDKEEKKDVPDANLP